MSILAKEMLLKRTKEYLVLNEVPTIFLTTPHIPCYHKNFEDFLFFDFINVSNKLKYTL